MLAAPAIAVAQEDNDEDHGGFRWDEQSDGYLPTTEYEPGRGKTMAIATTFGVVTGILVGALLLVFYQNPEADKNFDTMFIATGIIGFGGGIALGMTLPAGATREDAEAGLKRRDEKSLDWHLPSVGVTFDQTPEGTQQWWQANLLRLSF